MVPFRVFAVLAALLGGLAACSSVHPVSSMHPTNVGGAPGSADDLTTGGQGTSSHGDVDD